LLKIIGFSCGKIWLSGPIFFCCFDIIILAFNDSKLPLLFLIMYLAIANLAAVVFFIFIFKLLIPLICFS